MWQIIGTVLAKFDAYRYRHSVRRSLALNLRGEARQDGLQLVSTRNVLEVEWRARDIHPWDRGCPLEQREVTLVAQSLLDTDAAISRLFEALPYVDVLQVRVLSVESAPILGGTVYRSSLSDIPLGLSIGMRLRQLGITYHSAGLHFEPLPARGDLYDREWTKRFPELVTSYNAKFKDV